MLGPLSKGVIRNRARAVCARIRAVPGHIRAGRKRDAREHEKVTHAG